MTSPNTGAWLSIAFGVGTIAYVYGAHKGRTAQVPQGIHDFVVRLDERLAALGRRPKAPVPALANHVAPVQAGAIDLQSVQLR